MASKIISDKQKSALSIDSLLDTNVEAVASAVEQFLAPYSTTKVDVRPLFLALRSLLSARAAKMSEASQAHDKELNDDPEAMKRRDDATLVLYGLVTRLREAFAGVYGAGSLSSLGFSSVTPQDPSMLSAFAKTILSTVRDGAFPTPLEAGMSYDPSSRIKEIDAAIVAVEASLVGVAKEKREAQQTLAAKNQTQAEYDDAFSGVANLLVGVFALVGQEELVRKAKPSTRRPGQTEEVDAETPNPL
jgi:hypothetical protein